MNRNLGLCYTICWKFRASQINPFSYHYTLNKPLKNRKKVIINFRESRIENSHSNTKASLFYGNITIGIISGEWGSIIMLAGPTSPTYRGSTVFMSTSMRVNSNAGTWKNLLPSRLLRMFLIRCTLSNIRYVYLSGL